MWQTPMEQILGKSCPMNFWTLELVEKAHGANFGSVLSHECLTLQYPKIQTLGCQTPQPHNLNIYKLDGCMIYYLYRLTESIY